MRMIYNVEEEEEDDYVEEEEDDDDDDEHDAVEEEDRSQDLGPHFVRAWAVEMHFEIPQEPLYTEIYRKNAAAQIEPHSRNACQDFTRATLCGNLLSLCEPAQSKRMSRFHKSHCIRKFNEIYR